MPVIHCKDLKIKFPLFDRASRSFRMRISGGSSGARSFTALNGISFSVEEGERIGLLGSNGAGKSTLLRTLAGVYKPFDGTLTIEGETTSLFEPAVGTDVDATGYENIPLLMAARGIPKSKIEDVIADVQAFSELGDALNRPLRTYSAGMRLRIAFAVATFDCGNILLMDEVIGVGDQKFRIKSKERILNTMKSASTLILASHASSLLRTHCERGLVFDGGKIIFDGSIDEAIKIQSLKMSV